MFSLKNVLIFLAGAEFFHTFVHIMLAYAKMYAGFTPLAAEDIADAIVYCATRPLHVDISEMVIFPTAQASVHHIYKSGGSHQDLFKT
ncbi:MAG: hypothetical protein K2Y01_02005 [Rhabdochlamydiaceae bacterium]|nr:hypothetical protein [Rhabdochlamydiaceae bacterium]